MNNKLIGLVFLAGGLAACSGPKGPVIRLNQVGYFPQQEKVAVADTVGVTEFTVVNAATGEVVLKELTAMTQANGWTQDVRSTMDFSSLTEPGRYWLLAAGDTAEFEIKERPLAPLADAALKAFYYQRASMPVEETYAGVWNRPAGHPDDAVQVHPSAAGPVRKAGDAVASPGGWYDGSDYNKYVVSSAFSVGLMQAVYRLFPDYFAKQNLNIPESKNATPDLLDEMHYSLAWMLTMQDPADGGVYHKLTAPEFEEMVMPAACGQQRYVVQKSVTASLDFAAVMAQASMLFKPYAKDYPGFAAKALKAAERAYTWAVRHADAQYDPVVVNQAYDPDINTTAYSDVDATDEFFWAATELYYATGKRPYRDKAITSSPRAYTAPRWNNASALGMFAWLLPSRAESREAVQAALVSSLKSYLLVYASNVMKGSDRAAFHAPFGDDAADFYRGCLAEQCVGDALSLVYAYLLSEDQRYLTNAYRNMDYVLGRNPTGYCYVTGFGAKSPLHPYHRLSAADGIGQPVPGLLVGGPDGENEAAPDESYADAETARNTNGVSVGWNAGLASLAAALDALSQAKEE